MGISRQLPLSIARTPPGPAIEASWEIPSSFGSNLSRIFFHRPPPAHDPDIHEDKEDEDNYPSTPTNPQGLGLQPRNASTVSEFGPYPNRSTFELGDWFWNRGALNSMSRFKELIKIVGHPTFNPAEVASADWEMINRHLCQPKLVVEGGEAFEGEPEWIDDTGGDWLATEIKLQVPFRGRRAKEFSAGTFHHRKLLSVIKEKIADASQDQHRRYRSFEWRWRPPGNAEGIRIYGELYTSEEYIRVEKDVHNINLPDPSDNQLERVVLALMFWTDATLLANFGTAKLWPCYMFFGNDSKYRRAKVSLNLCNHVAYFEEVRFSLP